MFSVFNKLFNKQHLFFRPLVPCYRGKGLGKEVTRMMMCYGEMKLMICLMRNHYYSNWSISVFTGISMLGIQKFEVKIGLDNKTSISMFKKFHFKEVREKQIFLLSHDSLHFLYFLKLKSLKNSFT